MKTCTPLLALAALIFIQNPARAQTDTAKIANRVLLFADSLNKTDHYQSWNQYADLVPASVIKHYGGRDGLIEHVKTVRKKTVSSQEDEMPPEMSILSLKTENDQWQCVIRKSSWFHREDQKYHAVTYLVGQSKDEGETWRLFDVSHNTVANIIYLLPDVFGDLAIPEPIIISEKEELAKAEAAKQEAAKATASAQKGKAVKKK